MSQKNIIFLFSFILFLNLHSLSFGMGSGNPLFSYNDGVPFSLFTLNMGGEQDSFFTDFTFKSVAIGTAKQCMYQGCLLATAVAFKCILPDIYKRLINREMFKLEKEEEKRTRIFNITRLNNAMAKESLTQRVLMNISEGLKSGGGEAKEAMKLLAIMNGKFSHIDLQEASLEDKNSKEKVFKKNI